MQKTINVLFLDIGGVLLTNGWPHQSRIAAAKLLGFDYTTMNDLHEEAFPIWEAGKMSMDDYLNKVLFYEPRSFTKEVFQNFMFQQSVLLPQLLPWLIEWKKRKKTIRIFSLNNEPKELNDYRIHTYGLNQLFDGFVSSCDVKYRKPDAGIYKAALQIADVSVEECFYMDDREDLIEAAQALGFPAQVHAGFTETTSLLETFNV